jgi:hypothetical protein
MIDIKTIKTMSCSMGDVTNLYHVCGTPFPVSSLIFICDECMRKTKLNGCLQYKVCKTIYPLEDDFKYIIEYINGKVEYISKEQYNDIYNQIYPEVIT